MRAHTSLGLALAVSAHCLTLPVSFEQRDSQRCLIRFARGSGEIRRDRVILPGATLRFLGASPAARLEGIGAAAPSTYLRAGYSRTFPQFSRAAIRSLYPGVDAVFYGSGEDLEYDLQVPAGFPLRSIRISFDGAQEIRVDESGSLVVRTVSSELRQLRPRVFQRGKEIAARYVVLGRGEAGIRLGKYDPRQPITVDPVLSLVKYFGGRGSYNQTNAIATDSQGNVYIAGESNAVDFPTTSGSFEPKPNAPLDVLASGGKSVNPLQVGIATNVGVVAGTSDGAVLYAATDNGILVSGDHGATWRQTAPLPYPGDPNLAQTITVNAISLDPLDPATLRVATNVGIYSTDSGGEFWGLNESGLPVSANGFVSASQVLYDPHDALTVYAITVNPTFLAKSTDGGNTWTILYPSYEGEAPPPANQYQVILAAVSTTDSALYVIDGNRNLLKSTDGGANWMKLSGGFSGQQSIQIDPSNPSTIYILDTLGLRKSTDGGETFAKLTIPASTRGFAIDSSGAIYVDTVSLVYVSTDGGKTFAAVPHLASPYINTLSSVAGRVYVGLYASVVPFVMKLDPSATHIVYSTFLGGTFADGIAAMAVDSSGEAVVAGYTQSADFPVTVPAASPPTPEKADAFITKLSADGKQLIWSIELGGSTRASAQGVALDSSGAVYVTGAAGADFPVTASAFQTAPPSTACPRTLDPLSNFDINAYAFVSKLSADGKTLLYSTFLTGSCGSAGSALAVDASGQAVVAGYTKSLDFPVSANSYQSTFPSLGPQTLSLEAGFISKLGAAGDKLIASTFVGGGYYNTANAITLDTSANVYVTGSTDGITPGATPGAFQTTVMDHCSPTISIGPGTAYVPVGDAFVLKLNPSLSSAALLTYLGGGCADAGYSIGLDAGGDIWVGGSSVSVDFPLKEPFQGSNLLTGLQPGFVSEFSPDGSELLFSSFSLGTALALSPTSVYIAGANNQLAAVERIDPQSTPPIAVDAIRPVIAFPPGTEGPFGQGVAPGQLVQITGRGFGPSAKVNGKLDASGKLPFILDGISVFFDNVPAALISIDAGSIVCFVPFEASGSAEVSVLANGQRSNSVLMGIVGEAPQILAVANSDGTTNSAAHPAKLGSTITFYVSGLGQTNPPGDDGLTNAPPLPVPVAPVTVYFPGPGAVTPQFAGAAPGMIAGITQVNVWLPTSITAAGDPINVAVNAANAPVYVRK